MRSRRDRVYTEKRGTKTVPQVTVLFRHWERKGALADEIEKEQADEVGGKSGNPSEGKILRRRVSSTCVKCC